MVTWEDGNDILLRQWCSDAADADGDEGWLRVKLLKMAEPLSERAFIVRHQAEDGLRRLDDGQLMQVWFDRKKLDPSIRGMMIRKIWDELEIRHEGLTRRAINIKVPFVHGLDTTRMKQHIFQVLDEVGAEWPVYVKDWHRQNLRITTTSRQTISEVMCNVNQPWKFGDQCACHAVRKQLAAKGWCEPLPTVEGHIFLLGREYRGPCSEVLSSNACNIPKPTAWDVVRVWDSVRDQLPSVFKDAMQAPKWRACLEQCRGESRARSARVNTAAVFTLRKLLKGLVCGPTDKNNGELWAVCPCLYKKALDAVYPTGTGDYEVVQPKKLTAYRRQKFRGNAAGLLEEMSSTTQPPRRQRGGEEDVVKSWSYYYKEKGWNEITRFNGAGRLGVPYCLFKAKNITDPEVRKEKWKKARPIAPTFNHPMKTLLHLVGKAWYFVAKEMSGEHFIMNSTRDVPAFFEHVRKTFSGHRYEARVLDIEGCYPHMPKDAIRYAMRAIAQEMRQRGRTGVSVPKRGKARRCTFKKVENGPYTWVGFDTMLEVLEFSLNQAVFRMKDGRLIRQVGGIPMGDALSPAMTIGTCGWMEREWMTSLHENAKSKFAAKRYMDDILLFFLKDGWDSEKFYADFQTECYMAPLKLEEASADTFLESSFRLVDGGIRYRLKNANAGGDRKVWRYHAHDSYVPSSQRHSTMVATLKKVDEMASDWEEKAESAMHKLKEFADLGYPAQERVRACRVLARERDWQVWMMAATLQKHM